MVTREPDEEPIAETFDPQGRRVLLYPRNWVYMSREPERRLTVADVMLAVSEPDHVAPDPKPCRWRYYKRGLGPSTWLRVVVILEQSNGSVWNAIPNRRLPRSDRP